jgi:restriction endonuclease S subunit
MSIEYTILNLSEVKKDNEKFRIDSEYFKKEYLEIENKLKHEKTLNNISKTVDLQSNGAFAKIFAILNDDEIKTIPYIRSGNVGDFFINFNDLEFISKKAHMQLAKTQTKQNDILMARKGKIGGATLITNDAINFNSNDNVTNIRIINLEYIPAFVTSFLNSKYGIKQVERLATGNVQPWLSMLQIRMLKISLFSNSFQLEIEELVKTAHQKLEESKELYKQAEKTLLKELDLIDYIPTTENISVKSFSESFKTSGRLDAEYYSPKYDEILEKIENYHGGFDKLGNLVKIKKSVETGTSFYEETGLEYIRVSNLSVFEISKSDIFINSDYFNPKEKEKLTKEEKIAKLQPKKETILFSKDGSVGIAHKLNKDEKFITSGAILHLNIKNSDEVLPDFLTLVLNSILVKMQSERDAGGSIIQHWKVSEIEEVLIPKITKNIQI